MSKLKAPKPLEAVVQAECRDWLTGEGCRVWRRNTGMFTGEHKGKAWAFKAGEKGATDLFGVMPGERHFELEIKREGERPTWEQVCYLRATNRFAPSFWVDDLGLLKTIFPFILAGGSVEYLDDPWTFSVKVDRKTHRITAPGGEFQINALPKRHQ